MSFTDAEEDLLIQIVSQNPAVFDTNNEEYRNIPFKENVWQQIADQLGKSSDDCKKKWKFIRDGYKRFIRRHPSGSLIPKYSKNKRHQQLSFIDNYNFGEVTYMTASYDLDVKAEGQSDTDPIAYKEESAAISTENEAQSSDEDKPLKKPKAKRRKKSNTNLEDVVQQLQDSEDRTQALLKTIIKRKDDDVEHFCRHIAQVLRKLPAVEKAQAKKHLSAVLSEHEITAAKTSKNIDLS